MTRALHSDLQHGFDAEKDKPSPIRFLLELGSYPRLAWQHRALIRNFFRREFQGRFRGSFLGVIWVLIHPIFLFLTYFLVFGILLNMRALGSEPIHYPLYLFVGVLGWTAFLETTMRAMTMVVDNGNLIKKVAFPAQLLPLHLLAINSIVYGVGTIVFLIVAVAAGWPLPGWPVVGLPVVLIVQSIFALGFSLLLAAAYVFLRDLNQIWPIFSLFWFFATPIFWHEKMLGEEQRALLAQVAWINPMHHLIGAHRAALGVGAQPGTFGDVILGTAGAMPAAFLFLVVGFVTFRSVQHRFADEV